MKPRRVLLGVVNKALHTNYSILVDVMLDAFRRQIWRFSLLRPRVLRNLRIVAMSLQHRFR